jgi:hypothetical protein
MEGGPNEVYLRMIIKSRGGAEGQNCRGEGEVSLIHPGVRRLRANIANGAK